MPDYPGYLNFYKSGELKRIANALFLSLESCQICPRRCQINRLSGKKGFCQTAGLPEIFSFMVHHGEEPPISGTGGSGTIFFSHCNMGCVYCQNYEFSQLGKGREYTFSQLAQVMLNLQSQGCHNINLVTPTHVLPQILKSLELAISGGLKIPLVYNTSGYELAGVIKFLAGIVDIYLADSRYGGNLAAKKLSKADGYAQYNQEALIEMYRQVGPAEFSDDGLIKKGLIIRHLVLPNRLSQTEKIMKFISTKLSKDTYISLMSQYLPYHLASSYPQINRRLKKEEYEEAKEILERFHLLNGWIQESYGQERFAGVNIQPK
jgi:putative pyruvate formate lyase activating enzyme